MNATQAGNLTKMDQWFRYWMPYHLHHLEDAKRKYVYLPVNRDYKPLGTTNAREHLDYDLFRDQAMVFTSDPALFSDVWVRGRPPLFLYNDGDASRLDYFTRLEKLVSRSVKVARKPKR